MSMGQTDSPMEAVAIMNYLCLHHAGVWAWIAAAFLTTTAAAISFFSKIKSDSLHFQHSSSSSSLEQSEISATSVDPLDEDKDKEEKPSSSSTTSRNIKTSSSITTLSCTLEKTASGKFTLVYYPRDHDLINSDTYTPSSSYLELDFDNDDHIRVATPAGKNQIRKSLNKGGSISWSSSSFSNHQEGWESPLLKMKSADYMGWYRHQDLTLLDGNVVRLWKD